MFLDDLGVNLKPAAAMGMTTIKVIDPTDAIAELDAVVGFPLGVRLRCRARAARSWACSWAWTVCEPVAGLPDSWRDTRWISWVSSKRS